MVPPIPDHMLTSSNIPTGARTIHIKRTLPTLLTEPTKKKDPLDHSENISQIMTDPELSVNHASSIPPEITCIHTPQGTYSTTLPFSPIISPQKRSRILLRLKRHTGIQLENNTPNPGLDEDLLFTASPTSLTVTTSAGSIIEIPMIPPDEPDLYTVNIPSQKVLDLEMLPGSQDITDMSECPPTLQSDTQDISQMSSKSCIPPSSSISTMSMRTSSKSCPQHSSPSLPGCILDGYTQMTMTLSSKPSSNTSRINLYGKE